MANCLKSKVYIRLEPPDWVALAVKICDPKVIRLVSDILHSTELICSVLSFVSLFLTTNCTRHDFLDFS